MAFLGSLVIFVLHQEEQTNTDAKAVVSIYLSKIIEHCAKHDLKTKNELERIIGALPAIDLSMDEFLDESLDKNNIDKAALLDSFIKKYGLNNFYTQANAAIYKPEEERAPDYNLHKIFYQPSLLISIEQECNTWLLYNNTKSDCAPLLRAIIQFIMLDYIKTKFPNELPKKFVPEEKIKIVHKILKEKSETLFDFLSDNIPTQHIMNFISSLYQNHNKSLLSCMWSYYSRPLGSSIYLELILGLEFFNFWFDRLLKNLKNTSHATFRGNIFWYFLKKTYSIFEIGLHITLALNLSIACIIIFPLRIFLITADLMLKAIAPKNPILALMLIYGRIIYGLLLNIGYFLACNASISILLKNILTILIRLPIPNFTASTWLNHIPIFLLLTINTEQHYPETPERTLSSVFSKCITAVVFELGCFYPKGFPTNILFGAIGLIFIFAYFVAERLEKIIPDTWFFNVNPEQPPAKISLEFKVKKQKASISHAYNSLTRADSKLSAEELKEELANTLGVPTCIQAPALT